MYGKCPPGMKLPASEWVPPPATRTVRNHWLGRGTEIRDPGHQPRRLRRRVPSRPRGQCASLPAPQYTNHPGIKLDGFWMGPVRPRGQFASLPAPQYRNRAPGIKLPGPRDGSHPGHADSSQHWRAAVQKSGPRHQARRLRDGSHPGHADSSHHWLHRSTEVQAPASSSTASRWVPSGHSRSSPTLPVPHHRSSGPPSSSSPASEMGPIRPRAQPASLAAPQYRDRGPGHQARRLLSGSRPGHADSSHHCPRCSTELRGPHHQAGRLRDGSHPRPRG